MPSENTLLCPKGSVPSSLCFLLSFLVSTIARKELITQSTMNDPSRIQEIFYRQLLEVAEVLVNSTGEPDNTGTRSPLQSILRFGINASCDAHNSRVMYLMTRKGLAFGVQDVIFVSQSTVFFKPTERNLTVAKLRRRILVYTAKQKNFQVWRRPWVGFWFDVHLCQ